MMLDSCGERRRSGNWEIWKGMELERGIPGGLYKLVRNIICIVLCLYS